MKELAPFLAVGAAVAVAIAVAVTAIVLLRLRLTRVADALGADLTWCRVRGTRGGREFSYCTGSQHQRPALSLLDLPRRTSWSTAATPPLAARRSGEVAASIRPSIARWPCSPTTRVRAGGLRAARRGAVTGLLQGARDKLVLQRQRVARAGRSCWRGRRRAAIGGLDRLVELAAPHRGGARRAGGARDSATSHAAAMPVVGGHSALAVAVWTPCER
jgi:hypothetical protein